jgi:hypothetical protein
MWRRDLATTGLAIGMGELEGERPTHDCPLHRLPEQRTIAIGVEAVAGVDGMGIGGLHARKAAQRRDKHEKRGTRQMKVCHQGVDGFEAVTGRNENVGLTLKRVDRSIIRCRAFQDPQTGCADGDDPPACRTRLIDGFGDIRRDLTPFRVHGVAGCVIGLDGQERSHADMQRHEGRPMPASSNASKSASVKCSPAVGAATDPSVAA